MSDPKFDAYTPVGSVVTRELAEKSKWPDGVEWVPMDGRKLLKSEYPVIARITYPSWHCDADRLKVPNHNGLYYVRVK
jgi:hypothetical protein